MKKTIAILGVVALLSPLSAFALVSGEQVYTDVADAGCARQSEGDSNMLLIFSEPNNLSFQTGIDCYADFRPDGGHTTWEAIGTMFDPDQFLPRTRYTFIEISDPDGFGTCNVNSTGDLTVAECIAEHEGNDLVAYHEVSFIRPNVGVAVMATAADVVGDQIPALYTFFIKFGIPIILIVAIYLFISWVVARAGKGGY